LGRALQRGNVSLSLKVARDGLADGAEGLRVNAPALSQVLAALAQVEGAAMAAGVTLAQATAADVLMVRGVMDTSATDIDTAPLRAAILADLPALLAEFSAMRANEGRALASVIGLQLEDIARLTNRRRRGGCRPAPKRRPGRCATPWRGFWPMPTAWTPPAGAGTGADLAVKTDVHRRTGPAGRHISAARALLVDAARSAASSIS
jgi:hypothetical protein